VITATLEARHTDLYDTIRKMRRVGDITALDAMLNPADLSGTSRPEMLGLLRYTAVSATSCQPGAPSWRPSTYS
jgi:hypothetical protein